MSDAGGWETYFAKDERLLWGGAPRPGVAKKWLTLFLAIFGIPFLLGGLMIWASGFAMLSQGGWNLLIGVFLLAFGVPFLGVGLGLVFGVSWAALSAHKRVLYALSTQNAYIAKRFLQRTLQVYAIKPAEEITLTEDRDGAGTVTFLSRTVTDSEGSSTKTASFENIADARAVYHMIRSVQAGAHA